MAQEKKAARIASPEDDSEKRYLDALEIIRHAHEEGRPIVPFLGAGISAGSGYPLIDQLRSYLMKVKFFIKCGVYRTLLGQSQPRNIEVDDPENHLSTYIEEFGWPDLNQLNSDLYQFCKIREQDCRLRAKPGCATYWIDEIVKRAFKNRMARDGNDGNDAFTQYRRVREKQAAGFPESRWGRRRWRLQTATQHVVLEDMRLQDEPLAQLIQEKVWAMDLYPRVDWSRLLMELTEGKLGFIDALFAHLSLRYAPGASHVLLAHLVGRLGIKLLLTTNFDPFIEQALLNEGAQPRLFEIGRDAPPPDPSVVKQTLSVVKLHGGNTGLRIGERLDYALDEITQSCVEKYVPPDALLLVVGFSGYERRMMQLIEHLVLRSPHTASTQGDARKKVVWMHWEAKEKLPATVVEFEAKLNRVDKSPSFCRARLSDAAAFLLELYQITSIALPKSRTSYPALQKRVIRLQEHGSDDSSEKGDPSTASQASGRRPTAETAGGPEQEKNYKNYLDEIPFHLFSRDSLDDDPPNPLIFREALPSAPSVRMSTFVHQRAGYHLIWIDLEDHHTVAGIVAEIIDKMRVPDPDLPPLIFPLGPEETEADSRAPAPPHKDRFEKAVLFIHRALRRGRYVIAFDSLEGFGRPQTSHHGLPGGLTSEQNSLLQRMSDLLGFLGVLLGLDCGEPSVTANGAERLLVRDLDWYCCIACDEPASRHIEKVEANDVRLAVRLKIQNFVQHDCWEAYSEHFTAFKAKQLSGIEPSRFYKHVVRKKGVLETVAAADGDSSPRGVRVSDLLQFDSVFQDNSQTPRTPQDFHDQLDDALNAVQIRISRTIQEALGEFQTRFSKIESNTGAPAWLGECALPFLMVCIFRRPRSYVAIYTLWNQYLPGDWSVPLATKRAWIKKTLDCLSKDFLLNRMPGGYYWIPRHVHEWMYKALSESSRWRSLKEQPDEEIDKLIDEPTAREEEELAPMGNYFADRVTRLAFLTMIHSRIARFYFLHVFQRVQDVNALFEYVYHRISAIRYAKTLHVHLNLADQLNLDERSPTQEQDCRRSVAALIAYESIDGEQEPSSARAMKGQDASLKKLRERLVLLRLKFLQSFLNVLRRERETMLTAASTDTWLAWIDQLISELDAMVVLHPKQSGDDIKSVKVKRAWVREDPGLKRLGQEVRWYLYNLRGQLLREKRAWLLCIKHRIDILVELVNRVVAVGKKGLESKDNYISQNDRKGFQQQLSDHAAEIKAGVWSADRPMSAAIATKVKDAMHKLFKVSIIRMRGAKSSKSLLVVCQREFRDDRDGANHVATAIESLLDVAACCRHLYFEMGPAQGYHDIADKLLQIVTSKVPGAPADVDSGNEGAAGIRSAKLLGLRHDLEFDIIRFEVERLDPWWNRHIDCFGQHRSEAAAGSDDFPSPVKVREKAREIEKLRQRMHGNEYNDADELAVRMCQFRTQVALCLMWLEHCDDALRTLDQAMSGLREDQSKHRFLLAIVQCLRAETLMLSADKDVRRPASVLEKHAGESGDGPARASEPLANYPSARTKLGQAGAALQEAERLLRNGRRNIGQWRRLYMGKVQLEIESLLLLLAALEWKSEMWRGSFRFVALVHGHLKKGLEAIRGGWDCSLSPTQSQDGRQESRRDRLPWVGRWLLLMMAGYVALKRYDVTSQVHANRGKRGQTGDRAPTPLQVEVDDRDALNKNRKELASMESFKKRWCVLNESAGLNRFVEAKPLEIWLPILNRLRKHANQHGKKLAGRPTAVDRAWSREIVLAVADEQFGKGAHKNLKPDGSPADGILEDFLNALE